MIWLLLSSAFAETWQAGYYDVAEVKNLNVPVSFDFTPEGDIFIAGKSGELWFVPVGGTKVQVADLSERINAQGDRGLLGVAADPLWSSLDGGWVYLLYTMDPVHGEPDEDAEEPTWGQLARVWAEADGSVDVAGLEVILGELPEEGFPHCSPSHTVGALAFGADGALYVSAGDGARFDYTVDDGQNRGPGDYLCEALLGDWQDLGAFRAQSLESLAGKVLRIDPDSGEGLPDNPHWTGSGADNASRVWASGLRNPWRFTLHPDRGTLWLSDVGETRWEELDAVMGGENFGWPCIEGPEENNGYPTATPGSYGCSTIETAGNPGPLAGPALSWNHDDADAVFPSGSSAEPFTGATAIIGPFYQGSAWPADQQDRLIFGDFTEGWLRTASVEAHSHGGEAEEHLSDVQPLVEGFGGVVDMKAHPLTGELYMLNIFKQSLLRLDYDADNAPPVAAISATATGGPVPLKIYFSARDSYDPDGLELSYSWDFGNGATSVRESPSSKTYLTRGIYTVTLTVTDPSGLSDTETMQILAGYYAPTARIDSPVDGSTFALPRTFTLSGSGEDVDSTAAQLTCEWSIWLGHAEHEHPDWRTATGCSASVPVSAIDVDGYMRIKLKVTDPDGLSGEDEVLITPSNQPPVFDDPGTQVVSPGETLSIPITWTDAEGDTVNVMSTSLPEGAVYDPTSRTFTWTPTTADIGRHVARFDAEDDNRAPRSASAELAIEVAPLEAGAVVISIFDDWGGGYCAELLWTNTTGVAIDGWTILLGIDPAAELFSTWSGVYAPEAAGWSITPVWYNAHVDEGETLDLGFCANGARPTSAEFIGPDLEATEVTVTYTEWGRWGRTSCGDVDLLNTGPVTVDGWQVEWDVPAGSYVGSNWKIDLTSSGTHYTAIDEGWNGRIDPAEDRSFGFCTHGGGMPYDFLFSRRDG